MNIQENRHYIVTHWDTHNRNKEMRVWVDHIDEGTVKGHMSQPEYPLVSTQVWSLTIARQWAWTEV
jgi:hypothetical protein